MDLEEPLAGRWLVATTKSNATTSNGNVYASSDGGITWRPYLTGSFNAHNAITWAGDKFILVGYGGHILTAAEDDPASVHARRAGAARTFSLRLEGNTLVFTLPPGAAHIASPEMAGAIYTLSGRRLRAHPRILLSGYQGKLSIGPLPPGPYVLELNAAGNGHAGRNKYIKPFILPR